jgi:hypothetical protein
VGAGLSTLFLYLCGMEGNYEELKRELENTRNAVGSVLSVLEKMNTAMADGFKKVNERLSVLEGTQGMQGVNAQLGEIKTELHKIQKAYPYEEIFSNIQSIQKGEA